jgi:type IX secretion system PorP/SprF family membrane protein
MSIKKILVVIVFLIVYGSFARGQQLPVYSQYLYNKFLINPAVAGSTGYTSVNLTARQQWAGYYGAPQTFSLSYQTRLLKAKYFLKDNIFKKTEYHSKTKGRVGFGLDVFNDINGLIHKTGVLAAYSYNLWLNGQTQLSLGLAGTTYYYKIDQREIQFGDPTEPYLNSDFRKGTVIPDFNFGAYILGRSYSAGFSAQDLMKGFAKVGSTAYKDLRILRTYYLFGNYDFEVSQMSTIEPSALFKMSEQMRPQADIGLTYIYNRRIWAGITYRTQSAVVVNIGVVKDKFFIGYSYDYTTQVIQRATYGSHEFVLAIKFGESTRRYRWLDRY